MCLWLGENRLDRREQRGQLRENLGVCWLTGWDRVEGIGQRRPQPLVIAGEADTGGDEAVGEGSCPTQTGSVVRASLLADDLGELLCGGTR
jgi:hypothetical protein